MTSVLFYVGGRPEVQGSGRGDGGSECGRGLDTGRGKGTETEDEGNTRRLEWTDRPHEEGPRRIDRGRVRSPGPR